MLAVQDILRRKFAELLTHLAAIHWPLGNLPYAVLFQGPQSVMLDRMDNSSRELIPDLFDALMMHRSKRSTDLRDKIYALIGLTVARDDPEYLIDHSLSVRQVYINTADYLVRKSQNLDFICMRTGGLGRLDKPTWISNWASTTSLNKPIPHRHDVPQSVYSASGTRMADAQISCEDGILRARGICISSVKAVGQLSEMAYGQDYHHGIAAIHAWHIFLTSILGHGTEQIENLSRLLLCEELNQREMQGNELSDFLLAVLGMIVKYGRDMWLDIETDP